MFSTVPHAIGNFTTTSRERNIFGNFMFGGNWTKQQVVILPSLLPMHARDFCLTILSSLFLAVKKEEGGNR